MRLRVRLAAGGQTLRLEIPDSADLPQLQRALASQLGGISAEGLQLGLNKQASAEVLRAHGMRAS